MAEADALLTVSAGGSQDRMRNAPAARAMLHELHTETSLFSSREPPPERYLFILVRAGACQRGNALIMNAERILITNSSSQSVLPMSFLEFRLKRTPQNVAVFAAPGHNKEYFPQSLCRNLVK